MFKESFKYYKSKNPTPDLKDVMDFNNVEKLSDKIIKIEPSDNCKQCKQLHGLKPVDSWEIYNITAHPGLIFIRNPFTSAGQRYWCIRSLRDYSKKPNKSNLDVFNLIPEGKEWWTACKNHKLLINKLRWITLGYHHNWDTKIYSEDNKGEFPQDLYNLSRYVAEVVGYSNFNAEAAIVNYYHMDSTLSGHTDHSEENLEAPLLSFSFGQTAIFLIGGETKEDKATAMFLRSGDIVVMSKESRVCFHGVPKILQVDSRYWDNFEEDTDTDIYSICKDVDEWRPYGEYLGHSRININVRQVLKRGQKRLCDFEDKT